MRRFGISLSWKYQEDACQAGVICPIASKMTALSTFKKVYFCELVFFYLLKNYWKFRKLGHKRVESGIVLALD